MHYSEQIKLWLFVCSIIYRKEQFYVVYIYLHSILIKFKLKQTFKIKTFPLGIRESKVQEDPNNCVYLNTSYWRHILNENAYIRLTTDAGKSRIVRVRPVDSVSAIFMPDECAINFNYPQTCIIQLINCRTIKLASEVKLALVSGPIELSNAGVDVLISNYFKLPKLVYEDDLICVDLRKYAPELLIDYVKLNDIKYAYFKCKSIACKNVRNCRFGYFCVIGHTTFQQVATVQSSVIVRNKIVKQSNGVSFQNIEKSLLDFFPQSLHIYVKELQNSVTPFFQNKIHIQPIFLLEGCTGSGKASIVSALANLMGVHLFCVTSGDICGSSYMQTEIKLKNCFFRLQMCSPCILYLANFEQFGKNNEGQYDMRIISNFKEQLGKLFTQTPSKVAVVCGNNAAKIPGDLSRVFTDSIKIDTPKPDDRAEMLRWLIAADCPDCMVDDSAIREIADKANGFFLEDLRTLLYYSWRNAEFKEAIDTTHFNIALDQMQSSYNESIGAPKVPQVQWSDVGGLDDVKSEIIKTIELPLKHPEIIAASALRRSGILLYGPPGTGKTLIAKAVATEFGLCFLSVKGPELLNMYVGQSEQNVREVFEKARQASPCIIFFDELDALAPNRGVAGDSGGVMDRVVSQLLAEMDGLNSSATLFIIGATNRPDLVDPALLRPGRFDKMLYVSPCTDFTSKLSVLKALTRKFALDDKLDLKGVIENCPQNITGADLYGICADAWMLAAKRLIKTGDYNQRVVVSAKEFADAAKHSKPSTSKEDLRYFENLKHQYSSNKLV